MIIKITEICLIFQLTWIVINALNGSESGVTGEKLTWTGRETLEADDPEIWALAKEEKQRQIKGLELIASENFASRATQEVLGSSLTNKYSSGYPGTREYGGNMVVDKVERLTQKRALALFNLNSEEWGVNVQPYSGSPANIEIYMAVLQPNDRLMGLEVKSGGHHGAYIDNRKASASSIFFDSMPYQIHPLTGDIDYDKLEEVSKYFKPKLIITGTSSHPRLMDYSRFRNISDAIEAILLADISHTCGLIAAGVVPSPFPYADMVSTTTHKSLRGPRAAMIFYRKGKRTNPKTGKETVYDFEEKIQRAVFPGIQGGPHNNAIASIAVTLKQASEPHFKAYQTQVLKNSKALAEKLIELGYTLWTNGTNTHLLVLDLSFKKFDWGVVETVMNNVGLYLTYIPIGLRLGSAPLTSRGFVEKDFEQTAIFLDKALNIAIEGRNEIVGTKQILNTGEAPTELQTKIDNLKKEVEKFASKFPMPGFDEI